MPTKSEVETDLIQAWACFKRDEVEDAASFAQDAADELGAVVEKGWDDSPSPADCQPVPRLNFKDWWIANPSRWFRRDKNNPSEPYTIVVENSETSPEARGIMKKIIALVVISSAAGIGSNYLSNPFDGPTQLTRGLFAAVQQCESCETIRSADVAICTDCGSTKAIERIAAPLTHPWMGFFTRCHDGWQFKDGSTKFAEAGEYIVPELVVSKTMRM